MDTSWLKFYLPRQFASIKILFKRVLLRNVCMDECAVHLQRWLKSDNCTRERWEVERCVDDADDNTRYCAIGAMLRAEGAQYDAGCWWKRMSSVKIIGEKFANFISRFFERLSNQTSGIASFHPVSKRKLDLKLIFSIETERTKQFKTGKLAIPKTFRFTKRKKQRNSKNKRVQKWEENQQQTENDLCFFLR